MIFNPEFRIDSIDKRIKLSANQKKEFGVQKEPHSPDIEHWLALAHTDNVGAVTFGKLLKHFGSVEKALGASVSQLTQVEGIGEKTAEKIARSRGRFDVQKELDLAEKHKIWIINLADPRYPAALRSLYDPPPLLYIKGTLNRQDNLAIAIVGCRRCTHYGSEQAARFAHFLAASGFTIVSGLARGIDSAAHRGALSAAGRTIAVQGCGLSVPYPPENAKLFEQIAENGAVISELPLAYQPLAENFPSRNRIIAGLALATLVVEANLKSGALITAQAALDNNREVLAIPGNIDNPASAGCHKLIKQGARLIDSIEEIMDALGTFGQDLQKIAVQTAQKAEQKLQNTLFDTSQLKLSESEQKVYNCLDHQAIHIEQIIAQTDLPTGSVYAATVSLQLKGLIKQLPGNLFCRRTS